MKERRRDLVSCARATAPLVGLLLLILWVSNAWSDSRQWNDEVRVQRAWLDQQQRDLDDILAGAPQIGGPAWERAVRSYRRALADAEEDLSRYERMVDSGSYDAAWALSSLPVEMKAYAPRFQASRSELKELVAGATQSSTPLSDPLREASPIEEPSSIEIEAADPPGTPSTEDWTDPVVPASREPLPEVDRKYEARPSGGGTPLILRLLEIALVAITIAGLLVLPRAAWIAPVLAPLDRNAHMEVGMIPRNDTNSVSRAELIRDRIHDLFERVCSEEGVRAEITKSTPFSANVWVHASIRQPAYEPDSRITLRSGVRVDVQPRPFRRFDPELVLVVGGRRERSYARVIDITPEQVAMLVRHLAGRTLRFPRLKLKRTALLRLQFWRPFNRLVGVRHDWRRIAITGATMGVALLLFLTFALAGDPEVGSVVAVIALGAVTWVINRLRRTFILTSGKPHQEPRMMISLDSWQTVAQSLSAHAVALRQEILLALLSSTPRYAATSANDVGRQVEVSDEIISYSGIDGLVERRQIVARLRRAIAFIHVYSYSEDLYVGWDAHVNAGTWSETLVGEGAEAASGLPIRAYGVQAAWKAPNEYDVTDANFLIEWVHSAVSRTLRSKLKEHKIEQEIDFSIVREARRDVAGRKAPEEGKRRAVRRVD